MTEFLSMNKNKALQQGFITRWVFRDKDICVLKPVGNEVKQDAEKT